MPNFKPPTNSDKLKAEQTRKRLDKMIAKYEEKVVKLGTIKSRKTTS